MRPLSFEEREDLVRRAGNLDIIDFIQRLKKPHRKALAAKLFAPKQTDYDLHRMQDIRNKLAEGGTEYTPAQLKKIVSSLCSKLRRNLYNMGWPLASIPESDNVLFEKIYLHLSTAKS